MSTEEENNADVGEQIVKMFDRGITKETKKGTKK